MEEIRKEWKARNVSNLTITIFDVPKIPSISPNQEIDLLEYASLSVLNNSIILRNYINSGKIQADEVYHTHDDKSDVGHVHKLEEIEDLEFDLDDINRVLKDISEDVTSEKVNKLVDGSNADDLHTHEFNDINLSVEEPLSLLEDILKLNYDNDIFKVEDGKLKIIKSSISHEELSDINSSNYYHLRQSEYNILTDGGNADDLHSHDYLENIYSFTTDDLTEGSSNLYFTEERVNDRVNSLLEEGNNITLTYNESNNTLTIDSAGGVEEIGDLLDVENNSPSNGQVLVYDGTYYKNAVHEASNTTVDDVGDFFANDNVESALGQLATSMSSLTPPVPPYINARDKRTGIDLSEVGVEGAITWDNNEPITGYENVVGKGNFSPVSDPLGIDGVVENDTSIGDRGGIIDDGTDMSGIMNRDVDGDSGYPSPSHPAYAFAQGDTEVVNYLVLEVNGVEFDGSNTRLQGGISNDSRVYLTDPNSDNTVLGGNSGMQVSAQYHIVFPNGDTFDSFYRTGNWQVDASDMVKGYNYVRVIHYIDGSTIDRESNYADWVVDADITDTDYVNESLDNLVMTGSKHLSGVEYYKDGIAQFSADIDNAQRNTYIVSDAVTFDDIHSNLESITSEDLGDTDGDEDQQHSISNKTVTINATRLLNDTIAVEVNTNRTVQTDTPGDIQTISNILMDNATSNSNEDETEDFQDEDYRLKSNQVDWDDITLTSNWDKTESLANGGTAGYNDGLLVYNGQLVYPDVTMDSSISNGDFSIANGPSGNPDYSGGACTGMRYYYRYFIKPSISSSTFTMNFDGNGTFVPEDEGDFSGNDIKVSIRLPSQTEWMDCYKDFYAGNWADGDGCRDVSSNPGRNFNDWNLSVGTKYTANSGNRVYIRITVPDNWLGQISNLTWSFD